MRVEVVVVALVCAGCSTSVADSSDGGDASVDASRDAVADRLPTDQTAKPACSESKACEDPPPSQNAACIVSFDVQIVDLAGLPNTSERVFFCGTNLCTAPLPPDGQGKVHADLCIWFVEGALKYIGGPKYASFVSHAPDGVQSVVFPMTTLVPLPAQGADLPMNGGTVASNGVTLTLAANVALKTDPSESNDPDWHRFRAVEVPLAKAPPSIDPMLKLEVLWGLAPLNLAMSPPGTLSIPNTKSWPANATVELFINGADSYDANPPAPWGKWAAAGTAHVSPDGKNVVTDTGIAQLSMLGMRLKP